MGVQINLSQAAEAGVQLGGLMQQPADQLLICAGQVAYTGHNTIAITAPVQGSIRTLPFRAGAYAKAGTMIAELENREIIQLQQEYLEATNQASFYHLEYKRQGELTVDNATSMRKMQEARRDFQAAEVRSNALRLQLETFGICADSVRYDKLLTTIPLTAPRSGRILAVKTSLGDQVHTGDEVLILGEPGYPVLRLQIPEQWIRYLKPGQPLTFYLTDDSLTLHQAYLQRMPQKVDPVSHMAETDARLSGSVDPLLPGMTVTARISIPGRMAFCLDTASVLYDQQGPYVFVKDQGNFVKVAVKTGSQLGEAVIIHDFPRPEKADSIVVRGGLYLKSLLEHQHPR
jgi:cobalt-zinc-cadmium efflux system membrane fusion protein